MLKLIPSTILHVVGTGVQQPAGTAVAIFCSRGDSDNRSLVSHSSEDWKSQIKVPSDSVSGEGSLSCLQRLLFGCVLIWFCPLVCVEREISGVSSSSYKDTNTVRLGPHPFDLILPYLPPESPISEYSHVLNVLRALELSAQNTSALRDLVKLQHGCQRPKPGPQDSPRAPHYKASLRKLSAAWRIYCLFQPTLEDRPQPPQSIYKKGLTLVNRHLSSHVSFSRT